MSETIRAIHYVGSYPADTAKEAMVGMLVPAQIAGVPVIGASDGETGPRRQNWIRGETTALQDHPAFELVNPNASYADWDDMPYMRIIDSKSLTPESIKVRLGYSFFASEARAALNGLQQQFGIGKDIPLLVGLPAALDFAMSAARQEGVAHLSAFQGALLGHIRGIHELDKNVIIQLEAPVATGLINSANPHMPPAMQLDGIVESMVDTARQSPVGTNFGVHECWGDLNHEARIERVGKHEAETLVKFAAMLLDKWPKDRPLQYIHLPFAAGKTPPSLEEEDYASLAGLARHIPEDVRIIAGIAHEEQSLEEQRQALRLFERALGRQVAVAAACGLGRRPLASAQLVVRHMIELAKMPV